MDQDLKQRLVGTVVITAVAAIFVPMLFDKPIDNSGKKIRALKIPDFSANSQTVDSRQLPNNIDDVISLPEPLAIKTQVSQSASSSDNTKMQRWFIQVGIFGEESNAISLQKTIMKQGFPVIVTPVSTESGRLYRVRIGPELDKKRAETMKARVDKLNGVKGILALGDE